MPFEYAQTPGFLNQSEQLLALTGRASTGKAITGRAIRGGRIGRLLAGVGLPEDPARCARPRIAWVCPGLLLSLAHC